MVMPSVKWPYKVIGYLAGGSIVYLKIAFWIDLLIFFRLTNGYFYFKGMKTFKE